MCWVLFYALNIQTIVPHPQGRGGEVLCANSKFLQKNVGAEIVSAK